MITILLVEDEPNQRTLYQMELEDENYRIVLASDGREALQKVKEEHPDLVVLDLVMPGMDGLETLSRMLALNPRLPVVIYSAYTGFMDNFMSWVADAYLVKSSDVDLLKAEIRRALLKREEKGPVWPEIGLNRAEPSVPLAG